MHINVGFDRSVVEVYAGTSKSELLISIVTFSDKCFGENIVI